MTWRLLYVRPLAEKTVKAMLADRGMEAYYPMERVWRGLGGKRKPAERPLIPSVSTLR